jgi:hypothetical protein
VTNRPHTRELVCTARALLREAARNCEGDLETVRENAAHALDAASDFLDALEGAEAADVAAMEAML